MTIPINNLRACQWPSHPSLISLGPQQNRDWDTTSQNSSHTNGHTKIQWICPSSSRFMHFGMPYLDEHPTDSKLFRNHQLRISSLVISTDTTGLVTGTPRSRECREPHPDTMDFAVVQGLEFHHLRLRNERIKWHHMMGGKSFPHLIGRSGSHAQLEEIAIEIFILAEMGWMQKWPPKIDNHCGTDSIHGTMIKVRVISTLIYDTKNGDDDHYNDN